MNKNLMYLQYREENQIIRNSLLVCSKTKNNINFITKKIMGSCRCWKQSDAPLLLQVGVSESKTNNSIKTTQYNIITFLPLATLVQFKRLANVYFLLTAILQFIPAISPLSPVSAITPLIFVIAVSLIRTAIEEYGKYKFDREANGLAFDVYEGEWVSRRSDQLKVGDVIKIEENCRLPADIIVLYTANADGKCYISTSSLDGEKNLKNRMVLAQTQPLYSPHKLHTLPENLLTHPFITLQPPSEQLYNFNAQIQITKSTDEKKAIFININSFLYRDSVLKNTRQIIGVIVFAGMHTKIMLNGASSREKMSGLERNVNFYMLFIFGVQLLLIILCGALRIVLYYATETGQLFIRVVNRQEIANYGVEGVQTAATYFILLNTMIPISLLVSIQIVKFVQGFFITFDYLLRARDIGARAFRSSINEELGMVEYVFTDKTGTLTQNQMVLNKLVSGELLYHSQPGKPTFYNEQLSSGLRSDLSFLHLLITGSELSQPDKDSLLMLCICTAHECILNQLNEYHGSSPDEITLVSSAREAGYAFKENSFNQITISMKVEGSTFLLRLCELFQFDSDRKRMSVVLEHPYLKSNKLLLCKGADNVIEKRLAKDYHQKNTKFSEHLMKIKSYVGEFSRQGLRTLLFGYRVIPNAIYEEFCKKMNTLQQSQKQERRQLIDQLEHELYLMGASGVEDKLQEEVPSVIADMIRANIKVCMLTGDKLQTAENIAKSCQLFKEHEKVIKVTEKNIEEELFRGYCESRQILDEGGSYGLLVQGSALPEILDSLYFLDLFSHCSSGVCCRITPKNKAEMVLLAKHKLKKRTLSIGDGANDVPMIQSASIGIGIYGNEGMNAVQASDFAIPEFRGIWRLLFVHGRWNYNRIAEMIKYFFYKNIVFTLCQLWYAYFCSFSGTSIYDAFYLVLYNTIFTGGPVIVRALFEQDVNYMKVIEEAEEEEAIASSRQPLIKDQKTKSVGEKVRIDPILKYLFPLLYSHTQQQLSFTPRIFALLILQSIVQSLAIFALIYYGVQSSQLWIFSIVLYSTILALVTIRICYDITYWTALMVLTIIFTSIVPYILFVYVMSLLEFQLAGTFTEIIQIPDFYLLIFVAIGIGSLIQATFAVLNKYYFPTVVDFVRKQAKKMEEEKNVEMKDLEFSKKLN